MGYFALKKQEAKRILTFSDNVKLTCFMSGPICTDLQKEKTWKGKEMTENMPNQQ